VIVLDASVILAAFLNEPGGDVYPSLAGEYRISVFNLGEVASTLTEKGYEPQEVRSAVAPLLTNVAALSIDQVMQVGLWRRQTRRFGLSMGDRCCLALGKALEAEVYTTDRVWAELDLGVKVRVVR
jgi:ribonuclease VapC